MSAKGAIARNEQSTLAQRPIELKFVVAVAVVGMASEIKFRSCVPSFQVFCVLFYFKVGG